MNDFIEYLCLAIGQHSLTKGIDRLGTRVRDLESKMRDIWGKLNDQQQATIGKILLDLDQLPITP